MINNFFLNIFLSIYSSTCNKIYIISKKIFIVTQGFLKPKVQDILVKLILFSKIIMTWTNGINL